MVFSRLIVGVWCAIYASCATAHEFWIEADPYQVAPGAQIVGNLKNGQNFEGTTLSYFTRSFTRFDVVQGDTLRPVQGRMGDRPALNVPAPLDGLVSVVHETTPSFVTYREWEKFQKFADHKDFPDMAARHAANGFPAPPFKERYTRHAKALIGVGSGAGLDRALGLKTEFVAITNPYAAGFDGQMHVQLLYKGQPRTNAQVEVFDRPPSGEVVVTLHRTDKSGFATIPVRPAHTYLFDAVALEPILNDDAAVWDTFWAALTFAVPAR
ncbi:DUF4198 domain-containing protein [Tateyamaria armeniaca]|uniref:DUF4198 domain-containing protein n=1 Tax=Tateyamaria armeniaca TaxID=2518930 RepID=A0ABW8UZD5_9RHOB